MIAQNSKRFALYCRVSTNHGEELDYSSIDHQEASGTKWLLQNKGALPENIEVYKDSGFSGGNTNRPAFKRLMKDIRNHRIDVVLVNRIDRISRSLLDYLNMLKEFEKYNVSFICVEQQIDTSTTMGKLVLNVLFSFAQFERETISDRTRSKIRGARMRGDYTGGRPILGYDIERLTTGSQLIINPEEAEQVREIFLLYLEKQSLMLTVKELNRRGWTSKCWTTRKGTVQGGKKFNKNMLRTMLKNVTYIGKTRCGEEIFEGKHEAIIDMDTWKKIQRLFAKNLHCGGMTGNTPRRTVLLRNLLYCSKCGQPMGHTYTVRNSIMYRYYLCESVHKMGKDACVTRRIPAAEVEKFIVDQIRSVTNDPQLFLLALEQANSQAVGKSEELGAEFTQLSRKAKQLNRKIQSLCSNTDSEISEGVVELSGQLQDTETRIQQIEKELAILDGKRINSEAAKEAFQSFDAVWDALSPREQARILQLLIERIDYDSTPNKQLLSIKYRPNGIINLSNKKV